MSKLILFSFPLEEFERIQKDWIRDVISESLAKDEKKEEFLTRQEASNLLKITLPTLHEWSKRGLLKAYRINSRVRYRKSELESALKASMSAKSRRA